MGASYKKPPEPIVKYTKGTLGEPVSITPHHPLCKYLKKQGGQWVQVPYSSPLTCNEMIPAKRPLVLPFTNGLSCFRDSPSPPIRRPPPSVPIKATGRSFDNQGSSNRRWERHGWFLWHAGCKIHREIQARGSCPDSLSLQGSLSPSENR
jgi:hypothetical protein